MYLCHRIILGLIFCGALGVAWYFDVKIGTAMISDAMSLIGILFGFTMTAAVAMNGSRFIKDQNNIVDESVSGRHMDNAQRLVSYIECACRLELLVLLILVVLRMEVLKGKVGCSVAHIALAILLQTLYSSYLVLKLVLKFIRVSAKEV